MATDPQLAKDWKKYGRRNVALTTTAPAGSVSVLTQTTSGIEPAFLLSYTRRKKINPSDGDVTPDFIDEMGDKWLEFPVYHHWFKKWMDTTGLVEEKDSPYWQATANDIDWVQKVKLQAAAQKWICHAISNTTNLPADVSIETVKDIYMTGWELGCKGVTIYRDGSRSGVLVSNDKEKEEKKLQIEIHNAPKRPIELPGEVHHMTVLGEKWTFFVGMLEGRPYEVMGGLSKNVAMPKRVKGGKIVKHNGPSTPKARYDFHYDFEEDSENETILRDIATLFDNATYSAFTRTISLALRHGTDVRFVVEQIQKGAEKEDDLFSFSKAVSRVLKHYIADGIVITDKKCLSCGASDLVYQEGCVMCKSCGSSKCG
jgi:ribonucleoside-diphosphate reductase alpha chain